MRVPSTGIFCLPIESGRDFASVFLFFGVLAFKSSKKSSSESDTAPSDSDSDSSISESHSSACFFFFFVSVGFFRADFATCLLARFLEAGLDCDGTAFFGEISNASFLSTRALSSSSRSNSQIDSGVVEVRVLTSAPFSFFWRRMSSARSKVSVHSFNPRRYSYPLANSASDGVSWTIASSSSSPSSSSDSDFSSLGKISYPLSLNSESNSVRFLLFTTSSPLQTSSMKRSLLVNILRSFLMFSRSISFLLT